ncbi:MAG TPA: ABC transporter substrate-binding protein, partial [Blastocatellia bacterium]|nr:ABC transporter substrate-binding protein [Blastocatellia bacterium]
MPLSAQLFIARARRPVSMGVVVWLLCCGGLAYRAEAQDRVAELRWAGDSEGGAPYVFPDPKNPRQIIGYEVDLMNAIGRRLNRRAVFVQNQWDGLIPGLQRGNYDVAINGIEITEDRRQQIDFSLPYYATGEQLSVRGGDDSIHSLSDLKGKTAGTLKYSLAQRILEREGGIRIRTYDGQINVYEDLASGRLDAVLMDWPIAMYYSRPNPKLKFTGETIEQITYGIGLRKGEAELRKGIDEALKTLIRSGELRQIYEKWGLWNDQTERLFARVSAEPQPSGEAL